MQTIPGFSEFRKNKAAKLEKIYEQGAWHVVCFHIKVSRKVDEQHRADIED